MTLGKIIAIGSVILVIAYVAFYKSEKKIRLEKEKQIAIEKSVEDYSKQDLQNWKAYLTKKHQSYFSRTENNYFKIDWIELFSPSIVSKNTPYKIECDHMRFNMYFGFGEESIFVSFNHTDDAPPLGVHRYSIAAKKLTNELCDHLAIMTDKVLK